MATILVIGNAKETLCLSTRLTMDCHVKVCVLDDPNSSDWRKIYPDGLDLIIFMQEAKPEIQDRFKDVPTFGGLKVLQDPIQAMRAATLLTPELITPHINPEAFAFTIGGFFTGKRFVGYHHFVIQHRLMEGEKGPITPGMGTIITQADIAYYKIVLDPLIPLLAKAQYHGPVWINLSYDTTLDRPFLLSYRTDVDFIGMYAFFALCRRGPAQFIQDVLDDKDPTLYGSLSGTVRLSMAPWPHERTILSPRTPQVNFPDAARKYLYLADNNQYLGYVTARGDDLQEVRRRLYRTINGGCSDEVQYRRDIGQNMHILEYLHDR